MKTNRTPDITAEQFPQENLRFHVAKVRAIATLLENLSDNRYDVQAAWEEFGIQVEAVSEALMQRVMELEAVAAQYVVQPAKPAPAA